LNSKRQKDVIWREFLDFTYKRHDEHGCIAWEAVHLAPGRVRVCQSNISNFWLASYYYKHAAACADTLPEEKLLCRMVHEEDKCETPADAVARTEERMKVAMLSQVGVLFRQKLAARLLGRLTNLIKNCADQERHDKATADDPCSVSDQGWQAIQSNVIWTSSLQELRPRIPCHADSTFDTNGQMPGPWTIFNAQIDPDYMGTSKEKQLHSAWKKKTAKMFYKLSEEDRFKSTTWRCLQQTTEVLITVDESDDIFVPERARAAVTFPLGGRDGAYRGKYALELARKKRILLFDIETAQNALGPQYKLPDEPWKVFARRNKSRTSVSEPETLHTLLRYFKDFHHWVSNTSKLNWNATFGTREVVVDVLPTAVLAGSSVTFVYTDPEQAIFLFERMHLDSTEPVAGSTTNSSKLLDVWGASVRIKIPSRLNTAVTRPFSDIPSCAECHNPLYTPTFHSRTSSMRCLSCHFKETGAFCTDVLGCCEYAGQDGYHGSTPAFWHDLVQDNVYLAGNYAGVIQPHLPSSAPLYEETTIEHPVFLYSYTSTQKTVGSDRPPPPGGVLLRHHHVPAGGDDATTSVSISVMMHGKKTSRAILPTEEGVQLFFTWLLQVGQEKYAKYVLSGNNKAMNAASLRRAFCIFLAEYDHNEQTFTGTCDAHCNTMSETALRQAALSDLFSDIEPGPDDL
jgi:hypothetical protein